MQRQNFIFNPMHGSSTVNSQNIRHRHEESVTDFGPIGGTSRNQRQIQNAKVNEPLLLPSSTQQRQLTEVRKENKVALNGDRLSTLHSKLHQEAEKIKQWKINTEIEMKEKERKMSEATKTIESLRKSILELQFLNESVSSKLHEEKSQKEETTQKIATTRNMCNALKEHLVKLEQNITNGENMLDVQKFENKQRVEELQELVLKFQELEIKANCREHDMRKAVTDCETSYKQEIEILQSHVLEGDEHKKQLQEQSKHYEDRIEAMNNELIQAKEEMKFLKDDKCTLQEKYEAASNVILSHEKTIGNLENEKHVHAEDKRLLKESYEEKLSSLINQYDMLSNDINEKRNLLNDKEAVMEKQKQEICSLESKMQNKIMETEQCKVEIEELYKQNKESKDRLQQLIDVNDNLQASLQEKESLLNIRCKREEEMEEEIKTEREMTKRLREEISSLGIEIQKVTNEKKDDEIKESKIFELHQENENLRSQIDVHVKQTENDQRLMATLEERNTKLCSDMEVIMKQMEDVKAEQEALVKEAENSRLNLEQRNEDLKSTNDQLQQLEIEVEELRVQRDQQANIMTEEVETKEKQIEGVQGKLKGLQSKIDAKVKQINKLQTDTKSLRAQLKVQQRTNTKLENELSIAEKKAEQLENEKKALSEKADEKIIDTMKDLEDLRIISESLRAEKEILSKDIQQLRKEAELSCQTSQKAREDLCFAKKSFEAQITEMCSTLEKYKMENEKLMNAKEKELDEQAKQLSDTKKYYDENLRKKQNQIETLETTVEEKDKKINEVENNYKKLETEIADLKTNIANNNTRAANAPRTPKTPKTPQISTPMTPQGILRINEEKPAKMKHVAFNINEQDIMSDGEEDILVRKRHSPSVASSIPVHSKISSVRPIIRASPKLSTAKPRETSKIPENPGKRAKRVEAKNSNLNISELEKFQQLFPEFEDGKKLSESPKLKDVGKKSAFKSRVKKVIPRAKKEGKSSKMDLSWFDTDSTFGFSLEE